MKVTENNIGEELRRWFSKSVILIDTLDFNDIEVFKASLTIFQSDFNRYFETEKEIQLELLLSRAELLGIFLYRISREYFLRNNELSAQKYSLLGRFLSGIEIYYSANIGKGMKINHGIATVIGARTVIGENSLIHQGVTFGDRNGGRPILKNNVVVYAGAKILGNITIGNYAIVAANSVCITDVADNTTVAGVPAKQINFKK